MLNTNPISIIITLILITNNWEMFVKNCCRYEFGVSNRNLEVTVHLSNLENINFCDFWAQKLIIS